MIWLRIDVGVGTGRFATASATKGFTALTVMSLIEEGAIALSTTARSVLGKDLRHGRNSAAMVFAAYGGCCMSVIQRSTTRGSASRSVSCPWPAPAPRMNA